MKHVSIFFIIITLGIATHLQSMIDELVIEKPKSIGFLKPLLNNATDALKEVHIEKIKRNSAEINSILATKCIKYLIRTNSKNSHALPYLVPILFNEHTIDKEIQGETPLEILSRDAEAFNAALYTIPGTKKVFKYNYNIAFKIADFLKTKFMHVLEPLEEQYSYYSDYVRIDGKNYVRYAGTDGSNYKEQFLSINHLNENDDISSYEIEPNIIEYWKRALSPVYGAEIILRNNTLINTTAYNFFNEQCTIVYKNMKKQINVIKKIENKNEELLNQEDLLNNTFELLEEKIELSGDEQYVFFTNNAKSWYKEERNESLKKLLESETK